MTQQVKAISLKVTYESDIDGLKQDLQTLKSIRRNIENSPIRQTIKLDTSNLKSEAARAAMELKQAITAAMGTIRPGGGMSAGGLIIPPGAMASLARESAAAGKEIKRVTDFAADGSIKAVRSLKQLEEGLQQIDTTRRKKGKEITESRRVDTKPTEKLRTALDQIDRDFASRLGNASGSKGDVASVLRDKRDRLETEIRKFADLAGTSEYRRARKMQDRIDAGLANAEPRQASRSAADREREIAKMRSVSGSLDRQRDKEARNQLASRLREARAFRSVSASLDKQRDREIRKEESTRQAEVTRLRSVGASLDRQRDKEARGELAAKLRQSRTFRAVSGALDKQREREIGKQETMRKAEVAKLRSVGGALDRQRDKEVRSELAAKLREGRTFRTVSGALDKQRDREIRKEEAARKDEVSRMRSVGASLDRQRDQEQRRELASKIRESRAFRSVSAALDKQRDRERAKERANQEAETRKMRSVGGALDKQRDRALRKQESDAQIQAKESAQRQIRIQDRTLGSDIRKNKAEESDASIIQNRMLREKELNRILNDREALLSRQAALYRQQAAVAGNGGQTLAQDKLRTAALRTEKDLAQAQLERKRAQDATSRSSDTRGLESRFLAAQRVATLAREDLNTQEKQAKALKNRSERERELKNVMMQRAALTGRTQGAFQRIRGEAADRGDQPLVKRLDAAMTSRARESQRDMQRLTTSTRNSGHAFDFHSSSLLRNAATFTKWYIPAQAAMGVFRMIGSGVRGAVDAQRTFKVLNAVFRGTREDAMLLAQQTLVLSAANGRSAQEAAQASVSWARSGLTRIQILTALESSLRAANVAEISTADATKYLSSIYKGFGISLGEVAVVVDYLNSLSNQYTVTVEDLLQGISRSGKVAQQAGASYQELAAIIAVVADSTSRPGAEIGNSVKSTLNRLVRPEIQNALKLEFGIDTKTATGDMKKATAIFQELAALYPTLNTLEQGRLTNLVAGSLQSNRFTVILENYTDVLIAQAKAGMDANSAARENAEILSSLDAQIQSVTAAWTAFLMGLGETGAFDAAARGLELVGRALNDSTPRASAGPIYRTKDATEELILTRGAHTDDGQSLNIPDREFTLPQLRAAEYNYRQFDKLKALGREGKRAGDSEVDALFDDLINRGGFKKDELYSVLKQGRRGQSGITLGTRLGKYTSFSEPGKQADRVAKMIAEVESNGASALSNDLSTRYAQRRTKVDSLTAAQGAFTAMSRDLGLTERSKSLKRFEQAAPLLGQLPGGLSNVAEAELTIRPLIEAGKIDQAKTALMDLANALKDASSNEFSASEKDRATAIATTTALLEKSRAQLDALYEEQTKTNLASDQMDLQKEIDKSNTKIKEQQEILRGLTETKARPEIDPFAGQRGIDFDRKLSDLKIGAEAYDSFIQNIANTGIPELDTKLRIGAARMQSDTLADALARTQASNTPRIGEIRSELASLTLGQDETQLSGATRDRIASLRDELALREQTATRLDTELDKARELSQEAERKLRIEQDFLQLKESFDAGATTATSSSQRFAIGRTEGERLVNQQRGLMDQLNGPGTAGSIQDPSLGSGDANQDAREAGAITANLTGAKQGLLNIEDRMNRALAERANLEMAITDEARKQREEASKSLALASREDQLRAAAGAAVLRNRGQSKFSQQEFQFFNQETRGALSNYNPGAVQGLGNERENAERRAALDGEITLLATSLKTLRTGLDNARPYAGDKVAALVNAGNFNRPPGGDGANPGDRVQINLGNVSVQLDFAKHLAGIVRVLQNHVDISMAEGFRVLSKPGLRAPDVSPAAGTF